MLWTPEVSAKPNMKAPRGLRGWDEFLRRNRVIRAHDMAAVGLSPGWIQVGLLFRQIRRVARGLYRRERDEPWTFDLRLALAAERHPKAVVCLETALHLWNPQPTEPAVIWLAVDSHGRSIREPGLGIRSVYCSSERLDHAVEIRQVEGVDVKFTSYARSVVDCFKYRRHVGIETAVRAMHEVLATSAVTPSALIEEAREARVERALRSHLAVWSRGARCPELEDEPHGGPPTPRGLASTRVSGRPAHRRTPISTSPRD